MSVKKAGDITVKNDMREGGPQYLKTAFLGCSFHCISKLTSKPIEAALGPYLKPGYGPIILKLTTI